MPAPMQVSREPDFLRNTPRLHAGFRRGDNAELTAVYTHYLPEIESLFRNGIVIKSTGVRLRLRSAEDLEELINELFDRVFQRKHRLAYDVTRDFGPYLKVIARNLLADYWRRRGREVPFPDRDSSEVIGLLGGAIVIAPQVEAEHGWLEPKAKAIALQYSQGLVSPLREVFVALYVEGMTQEEAAAHLGISRKKLRKRRDRLREELRELLEQAGIRASIVELREEDDGHDDEDDDEDDEDEGEGGSHG
jgi:RNA polymerase sigma factor (sigma-70 family)